MYRVELSAHSLFFFLKPAIATQVAGKLLLHLASLCLGRHAQEYWLLTGSISQLWLPTHKPGLQTQPWFVKGAARSGGTLLGVCGRCFGQGPPGFGSMLASSMLTHDEHRS